MHIITVPEVILHSILSLKASCIDTDGWPKLHGVNMCAVGVTGLSVNKLLIQTQCITESRQLGRQYLIDVDAVFLHVVPVVDLPPLCEVHSQDSLCGQIPVDHGNLWRGREREAK